MSCLRLRIASLVILQIAPGADQVDFTIPQPNEQFSSGNPLFTAGSQVVPLTNAQVAEVSNFSFDSAQVMELLGLVEPGTWSAADT